MDSTPLIFSSIENIQISQSGSGSIDHNPIISSTQAGSNTLTSSSSYDINTQVPLYTSVVVPDTLQPSMSFTDSASVYQPSVSGLPSTTKVRFILIGVLTFLSGFLLLPMVIKKLCSRDRRRRMTIRLIRKPSDTDLHHNQPSSPASFLAGDKSVEGGLSTESVTTGERGLSCAHSAGLAGIGTNKLNYTRVNHTFPRGDENRMNSNFDNPYGTPTYVIGQGLSVSPSYSAHLPRKVLELPPLTNNLGAAQYHGQGISKTYPVPLKTVQTIQTIRAISPARTRLGVSSWLKNGSYIDSQSPSFTHRSVKPSEGSMANNNFHDTTRQPTGSKTLPVNHDQNLLETLSSPALTYPYHNQTSNGNSVMYDTERNGCMIFLKDSPAVSVKNQVTARAPCNICPPPTSATRTRLSAKLFPNARMEKAPGIAF